MKNKTKILIVEDEYVIALDIRACLENNGYEVTDHVTNGEDALKSISINAPNLLLMDIKIDGNEDGVDVAKLIYEKHHTPIIFLTSYSNKDIIERAKRANPYGYIIKPYEDKELLTNIEIALNKHQTEIKIKESEIKYRNLSESIQQIIFEFDIFGKFTYINQPGLKILGLVSEDHKEDLYIQNYISQKEYKKLISQINQRSNEQKSNYNNEFILINKLGKRIFIEEHAHPVYENNQLTGYRGIFIDITSKIIKEMLSNVTSKLNYLFDDILIEPIEIINHILEELNQIFIYIEDIYFNKVEDSGTKLFKYNKNTFEARRYSNGLTEYTLNKSDSIYLNGSELNEFRKKNKIEIYDKRGVCWCGFPLYYSNEQVGVFALQSFTNENALTYNEFEYLKLFFKEVQSGLDRHNSKRILKFKELKYKNLINSINEGIIQVNFENEIIFVNKTLCNLFEYSEEELVNKNLFEAIQFNEENKEYITKNILNNKNNIHQIFKLDLKSKSGKKIKIALNISPLLDDNGICFGIIGTINDLTEKESYLDLIKEGEFRFGAIFEQAAVGVAIIDTETGNLINVNNKYCDIFQYTKNELEQMNFMQFTHPDDLEVDVLNMKKLINGEIKEFTIEKRHFNKFGEIIWVNLTVSPLWKPNEKATKHIAILEDITRRKSLERSIYEAQIEKDNILKSMPDSVVVIDPNGIILNAYLKYGMGILKEDIYDVFIGESWKNTLIPEIIPLIENEVELGFKSGQLQIKEIDISLKNNTISSYFEIRVIPTFNNSVLLIIKDITVLKNNILEIKKLLNITEKTREMIFITDHNGKIEYVNPMFKEVTGYDIEELKGSFPSIIKSDKHTNSFYKDLWTTIKSGQTFKAHVTNSKKNGEHYIEDKMIIPIINDNNEITNYVSVGRDITEEKKNQKKLLKYQKFEKLLERKEQKYRTISIIQGQEIERKRLAAEIHDGLGQMLTVVYANLDQLKRIDIDPIERQEKTEIVSQMIAEVIQESRRISHNLSPVGLYEFGLDAVLTQLVNRINTNIPSLRIEYISNINQIRFKSETEINIYRIIQESIQNSIKHSNCKKITINLLYTEEVLKLLIEDDGIGFKLNMLEGNETKFKGIVGIKERANIIGAKMAVKTDIGKGYALELNIKVKKINND